MPLDFYSESLLDKVKCLWILTPVLLSGFYSLFKICFAVENFVWCCNAPGWARQERGMIMDAYVELWFKVTWEMRTATKKKARLRLVLRLSCLEGVVVSLGGAFVPSVALRTCAFSWPNLSHFTQERGRGRCDCDIVRCQKHMQLG